MSAVPSAMARVGAVVVTFHPDPQTLGRLLRQVLPQVEEVVIVDNGSAHPPLSGTGFDRGDPRLTCRLLGANLGIAAAQNAGIRQIAAGGRCSHVLLLDHDSIPDDGMIAALAEALARAGRRGDQPAAAGPAYRDPVSGRPGYFVRYRRFGIERINPVQGSDEIVHCDFLIASGTLIDLDALATIGPMDERLFIDHVDTDWCLRARALGFSLLGVPRATMAHSLGDRTIEIRLRQRRAVSVHSPLRLYYIVRNSLLVARQAHASRAWVMRDVARTAAVAGFFMLCQSPRLAYVRMIARGLFDGLRNRSGPLR